MTDLSPERLEKLLEVVAPWWESTTGLVMGENREQQAANMRLKDLAPALARRRIADAKRIAELEEALRKFVYETTHLSPCEANGDHKCRITAKILEQARAALKDSQ